ncbi:hypothetical protein ASPWEDRAFT_473572 [Aspergillus wentii DTO 134E9]|uniref:Uncharacterized protein n=1 Tax=Aspergillus wentii DTO 134E9 TaxID=1073089 RepID=A0A1L9RID7_ASPWE|nr:uncharacterized protein ASPWEDRAFT_473572 [Aspergillus wentii DTO 134E9]OJJ34633.1 hypothetical protein ASPWEDRAFT_473572 [Aspergillus wentii DTO 134E9]
MNHKFRVLQLLNSAPFCTPWKRGIRLDHEGPPRPVLFAGRENCAVTKSLHVPIARDMEKTACIWQIPHAPARVARLLAENEQLRERLRHSLADSSSVQDVHHVPHQETPVHEPPSSGKHGNFQSVVSGIFISANGDSRYHGLTSTLFDDSRICRQDHG